MFEVISTGKNNRWGCYKIGEEGVISLVANDAVIGLIIAGLITEEIHYIGNMTKDSFIAYWSNKNKAAKADKAK